MWLNLLELLPDASFLAIDLHGHGDSDWGNAGSYTTAGYAGDIAAAARMLGGRPHCVIGHSNGAMAGLWYATSPASIPCAVVMLDIGPRVPDEQVEYFRQRAHTVAQSFDSLAPVVRGQAAIDPGAATADLERHVMGMSELVGGRYRLKLDPASFSAWQPAALDELVPRLRCPLVALRGGASLVSDRTVVASMVASAPGGRLVELQDAGHFLMLSHARQVADEITRLAAQHESCGQSSGDARG